MYFCSTSGIVSPARRLASPRAIVPCLRFVDYTALLQGFFRLAVALFILLELRRLALGSPPVAVALGAFFLVNGAASLNDSELIGYEPTLAAALDLGSVLVLGFLLVSARRLVRATLFTVDEAAYQMHEYERARRDYQSVVQHRMFGPLATIRSAAETIRSGLVPAGKPTRDLLDTIVEASEELEYVVLEPEQRRLEERGLEPIPRLRQQSDRGRGQGQADST